MSFVGEVAAVVVTITQPIFRDAVVGFGASNIILRFVALVIVNAQHLPTFQLIFVILTVCVTIASVIERVYCIKIGLFA